MEDQVRRQIRDATPVLNDLSVRDMTGRVFFRPEQVDGETVWRVQPGVISRINAYYPLNAYRSAVSGACTATYDVIEGVPENICIRCRASDFRGRPASPRITCYVDGSVGPGHAIRAGENMVEEVIRNTRFLPAPAAYCFQDEVRVVSTAIDVTGGRYNNDNAITPDTRPLPQLCG
jgi:hypothetical protein